MITKICITVIITVSIICGTALRIAHINSEQDLLRLKAVAEYDVNMKSMKKAQFSSTGS